MKLHLMILFFLGCALGMCSDAFRECLPAAYNSPISQEALRCVYAQARAENRWEEGGAILRGYADRFPQDPWIFYYLGHFELKYDPPQAAESFQKAAQGFQVMDMSVEVFKALDRRILAFQKFDAIQEIQETETELETLFQNTQDPILKAYILHRKAKALLFQGVRLDDVLAFLAEAGELAFPDGPQELQLMILRDHYSVAWDLGLAGLVERILVQYTALAETSQASYDLAMAQYRWATLAVFDVPSPQSQADAYDKAERAYVLAQEDRDLQLQALSAQLLGKLSRGEARRAFFEQAIAFADQAGEYAISSMTRGWLACEVAENDLEDARFLLNQVQSDNQKIDSVRSAVFGWEARMKAQWCINPPNQALENSLHELALIEAMRANQTQDLSQIQLFQIWSRAFFWLSGRLLLEHEAHSDQVFLDQAFGLAERVRARNLLETLDQSPSGQAKDLDMLGKKLDLQAEYHWQLAGLPLSAPEKAEKLAALKMLESEIEVIREKGTAYSNIQPLPEFANLDQLQAALGEEEVILAFQLQPSKDFYDGFGGGSWLWSITKDKVKTYALSEFFDLLGKLELFLGLLEQPETFEHSQQMVAVIYQNLLGEAFAELPETVSKLWIIPDKILYKMPFGVLRPEKSQPTLAETFQLTTIPSATLWLKWRSENQNPFPASALSLADPTLPDSQLPNYRNSARRAAPAPESQLGRLPFAREEGKALMQYLGGHGKLLLGEEATEAYVKTADLSRYGLLHFAAHAFAGDEIMRDSAVVLAPGDGEDGWLRPSDIAKLKLQGQVVVLSSCQSASGAVYQGEGVLSLGRAFFQAGAHVVVGSLWKLRDDEAAILFEAFYRHLAKGLSVSLALKEAQSERMKAGAPVSAWSGVTVLGNGDLVPFPGGVSQQPGWLPFALVGLALSLLLGFRFAWQHGLAR